MWFFTASLLFLVSYELLRTGLLKLMGPVTSAGGSVLLIN